MAKSTPRSASKTAPSTKSTPTSASASASKKRVRLSESTQATPSATATATSSPASTKKSKSTSTPSKKDDKDSSAKDSQKKGKNGVVLRDLRDKPLDEIEKIKSVEQPSPEKGALKKTKETKVEKSGKGKRKAEEEEAEEIITLEIPAGEGAEGEDDDDEDDSDFDEELLLEGFDDDEEDGEDSSDDEMEDEEEEEKKKEKTRKLIAQLPKVKGNGEGVVEKKLEGEKKAKKEKAAPVAGTVYLGRIPKGFYEEEMRSYFSQFGEVTRLRLSRNKKTGASKHYAFLEFRYASVAQIVQETMDNYLLSGHILVCKVIPQDQVHPKLWVGANRKFRVVPAGRKEQKRREQPKTEEQKKTLEKRLLSREEKKRAQLAELGIEYDFSGFAGKKVDGDKQEKKVEEEKGTPAKGGKKGRKSAGGEPAKKKPRKSK
ncbi:hypothetical protein JCM11641_007914 [Rhodosporidiobolus odoratus]